MTDTVDAGPGGGGLEAPGHKRTRSAAVKYLVMASARLPSPTKSSPIKTVPLKKSPVKIHSSRKAADPGTSFEPGRQQALLSDRNQNRLPLLTPTGASGAETISKENINFQTASTDQHAPIWAQFATTSSAIVNGKQGPEQTAKASHTIPVSASAASPGNASVTSPHPAPLFTSRSIVTKYERPGTTSVSSTSSFSQTDSRVSSTVAKSNLKDSGELDAAFEAILASRNVPESMRLNMRTLHPIVKAEFVRHGGLAEYQKTQSEKASLQKTSVWDTLRRGRSKPSANGGDTASATPSKRERSRGRKAAAASESPLKRPRSISRPRSLFSLKNLSSSSIHSMGLDGASESREATGSSQQPSPPDPLKRPADFIHYLSNVAKPEDVEVGKLHKLRLLLRNESVSWVDTFIVQGGMGEILNLLNGVRTMTWREEHEDLILHEVLLCLKGLCTTERALEKLAEASPILFPDLLRMLFDEERRGPAEFTTRGVVINLLFIHLARASPQDMASRARMLLSYLADPRPSEENRPVGFLLEMQERQHQARPYSQWCKECVNVTKEVFWIFMHHSNVLTLAGHAHDPPEPTYRNRCFPKTHPPEALNPWVGGVEWEATNYLAAHVDLITGLLACLDTASERNRVRQQLKDSGLEKVIGALRLCKEKFYPASHDAARSWVEAAIEDGWDVEEVRVGACHETTGSPSKTAKPENQPPKLELPKLDLGSIDGID